MEAAFALANAGTYKEEAKPKAIAKPQNLVKSVASKSSNLETKKSSFIKDTANKENTTSFNSLLSSSTSNVVVNASRVGAKEGKFIIIIRNSLLFSDNIVLSSIQFSNECQERATS